MATDHAAELEEARARDVADDQLRLSDAVSCAEVYLALVCPVCHRDHIGQYPNGVGDEASAKLARWNLVGEAEVCGWVLVRVGTYSAFVCSEGCARKWVNDRMYITDDPWNAEWQLSADQRPTPPADLVRDAVYALSGAWFSRKDVLRQIDTETYRAADVKVTNVLRAMRVAGELEMRGERSFTTYRVVREPDSVAADNDSGSDHAACEDGDAAS